MTATLDMASTFPACNGAISCSDHSQLSDSSHIGSGEERRHSSRSLLRHKSLIWCLIAFRSYLRKTESPSQWM